MEHVENNSGLPPAVMPHGATDEPRLPWVDICFSGFVLIAGIGAILLLLHS